MGRAALREVMAAVRRAERNIVMDVVGCDSGEVFVVRWLIK